MSENARSRASPSVAEASARTWDLIVAIAVGEQCRASVCA
jgi:hypothetical protein